MKKLMILFGLSLCLMACKDKKFGQSSAPLDYEIAILGQEGSKVSYAYTATSLTDDKWFNTIKNNNDMPMPHFTNASVYRDGNLNYPTVKIKNTTTEKISVVIAYHEDKVELDDKVYWICPILENTLGGSNANISQLPGFENVSSDSLLVVLRATNYAGLIELEPNAEGEVSRPAKPNN